MVRKVPRHVPLVKNLIKAIMVLMAGLVGYRVAYEPLVVQRLGLGPHGPSIAQTASPVEPSISKSPAAVTPPPPEAVPAAVPPTPPTPSAPVPPTPAVATTVPPKPAVAAVKPTPPKPVIKAPAKPKPAVVAKVTPAPAKPEPPQPPPGPTLEEITKNWTEIPKSLFAQHPQVTLKKDVDLKMGNGSMSLKAGNTVVAVDQENGMLIIASPSSPAIRGTVALDDTDIKKVVTALFEQWKVAQAEIAKKGPPASKPDGVGQKKIPPMSARNTRPTRNSDGSYAILMESMRRGEVREITPQKIKKWGEPEYETIDGKDYWTIIVSYTTTTILGDFNVDAQARIAGGKVEKWVYTSTGETVP